MLHPTLEDAWSDFSRSLDRRQRSKRTTEMYRKSYDSFWGWAETADIPHDPGRINYRDINSWVDWMLSQPAKRGGRLQYGEDPVTGERVQKMVSPNTVRIRWQSLRPFFTWWAKEMEEPNPFDKADAPKLNDSAVEVAPLADLRLLLHACNAKDFEGYRDTALIRLMIDTGARAGELVAMTVDSWDRRADLVTLTGKTGTRIVPISPSTGEAMARYLRVRTRNSKSRVQAMWLGKRGALAPGGIAQMLYRRCDQAGIPRIHPHVLRHTWAHEMKRAGLGESEMMSLGGWSTPAMVHRYGKSAAVSRAHEAARRIKLGDQL